MQKDPGCRELRSLRVRLRTGERGDEHGVGGDRAGGEGLCTHRECSGEESSGVQTLTSQRNGRRGCPDLPSSLPPNLAGTVSPHTAAGAHGIFSGPSPSLTCLTSSTSAPSLPPQKTSQAEALASCPPLPRVPYTNCPVHIHLSTAS